MQDEDLNLDLSQVLSTARGLTMAVSLAVCGVAMLPFIYIEVCTIHDYGWQWFQRWNVIDGLTYIFQARP